MDGVPDIHRRGKSHILGAEAEADAQQWSEVIVAGEKHAQLAGLRAVHGLS